LLDAYLQAYNYVSDNFIILIIVFYVVWFKDCLFL